MHSKLKHIDTKYHLIHDHVQEGKIVIKYVKTEDNIADFLMKPIAHNLLASTHNQLGMVTIMPLKCSVGKEGS